MSGSSTTAASSFSSSCVNATDTAWMLVSTLLVLVMVPALAFFEAGMLRSKNTLSLVTQMFSGIVILSVMWILIGFSLTFGDDNGGFIGNFDFVLWINGVDYDKCSTFAPTIPTAAFALFHMMFAAITPLLITGAFAERMKFKVYIAFITLWEIIVYYPVAHWIWGSGFLSGLTYDFAGGVVIHTTAGSAALVSALVIGRRNDFEAYHGDFPPSNLPLAAVGAALLWMGWFGFNGGSALAASSVTVSALVSTQIACSVSGLVWLALSWKQGHPSTQAILNGAIAGLAGITPASGYVNTPATVVIAVVLGFASYFGAYILKRKLKIDDALDVSMVHGLTGVIGSLSLGIFADHSINPNGPDGAWYGRPIQLWYQVSGVFLAAAWSSFWTFVLLKFLGLLFAGIRVHPEEEDIGLDYAEHNEVAYHNLHVLDDEINHGHGHGLHHHHHHHYHAQPHQLDTSTHLAHDNNNNNDNSRAPPSPHRAQSAKSDAQGTMRAPLLRGHSLGRLPLNHEYRRVLSRSDFDDEDQPQAPVPVERMQIENR